MNLKMNLDFSSILKKVSYGDQIRPVRDWFLLVSAGAALLLISAGWNLWILQDIEHDDLESNAATAEAFDATPIESVRKMFEARATEEAKYVGSYRFVDPSR